MDLEILRGLERIIVVIGAIVFAYLGYRLYLFGVEKGRSHLTAESKFYKFVFSGTGPGLFFMAFGGVALVSALFTGGGERTKVTETFLPPIKSETLTKSLQPIPESRDSSKDRLQSSRQIEIMTAHKPRVADPNGSEWTILPKDEGTTENLMPPIKSEALTELQQHTRAPPEPNERPFPLSRQIETTTVHDMVPPTTPRALAASSISTSQINLSWNANTDNAGVMEYRVFRCIGTSCIDMTGVARVTGTTYQDTGLTANTAYVYAVVAVDTAGNMSNKSAKATATTFTTPNEKKAVRKD